jgi:hypothetical protein
LLQYDLYHAQAIGRTFVVKPKQQDTMMRLAAAKDKFTKIFVIGNENSSFAHSPGQDMLIFCLGHCLRNGKYVMAETAQVFDYSCTGRLVNHELHGGHFLRGDGKRENILIGQHHGGVGQGSADVIGLQTGVLPQDITLRYALGQHPHDELHRYTRSSDDRLPHHYLGIYADTLPNLFVHRLLLILRGANIKPS